MEGQGYRANRDKLVKEFVNTALQHKYWIYQPQGKNWWTPEEFQESYTKGSLHLPENWMDLYKIMNPLKGVAAADIVVNEIQMKRSAFVNRVTAYYQNK